MPFTSKYSPEQWAEARRLRVGGASFRQISERVGIKDSTIGLRARNECWDSPAPVGASLRTRPSPAPAPINASIRGRLALRLYRVIECRIRMMELRMIKQLEAQEQDPDSHVTPAPTKDERESFAALIDSINKVTEMASEPAAAPAGRGKSANRPVNPELAALSDDIDPDGLAAASEKNARRRDIAERLGKMFPPS